MNAIILFTKFVIEISMFCSSKCMPYICYYPINYVKIDLHACSGEGSALLRINIVHAQLHKRFRLTCQAVMTFLSVLPKHNSPASLVHALLHVYIVLKIMMLWHLYNSLIRFSSTNLFKKQEHHCVRYHNVITLQCNVMSCDERLKNSTEQ